MDIAILVTVITTISGAVFFHFYSINRFKDKIHSIELEMEKLKSRDELQQQIIDTFQKQIVDHLPALMKIIVEKGGSNG